ncbi:MAG: protein-L-isoaspartate(D-aspartate) O-methyltransferase [Campylobacterales bacterium]|nr:protein-L-isoaspartate(D-aspartate) O-methyltransferase [Campylobacterales bacterium]
MKLERMVQEIETHIALDHTVANAFLAIDREVFVPAGFQHLAYKLDALPMQSNQWISSPLTVAKMTQYLCIDHKVDSILEVGCGSGYQAAILSKLSRRVFSIERIDGILKEAKERFSNLGLMNIITKFDDGQNGWEYHAPYERILLSASIESIPQSLFDQLTPQGILVAPILTKEGETIMRFTKESDGSIRQEELEPCRFVPILDGVQKAR